jgi:class 3 adenylate cyclase
MASRAWRCCWSKALAWAVVVLLIVATLACAVALIASARRTRQLEHVLADTSNKLMHLQSQFARFVPADVVERLTDASHSFTPERRQVTILFADLRDSTALCAQLDPAVMVGILNDYFGRMVGVIHRHHGHATHIMGDGLLAMFGALEHNPWQARDAVLAALDMRTELAVCNAQLVSRGLPPLRFGVGIHGGEVVAGVIGSAGLSNFAATGDPVNMAARVESLTAGFSVDLLVTEEVRRALDARFVLRAMPPMQVKGRVEPIQTYFVAADTGNSEPPT